MCWQQWFELPGFLLKTGQIIEEDEDEDEEEVDEEANAEAFMQEQMAKLDEEKSAILNNQSLIAEVGTTMIIVIIKIFLLPCAWL